MFLRVISFLLVLQQVFSVGDDVIEYTDNDFDEKIGKHDTALVMFYAPWCQHCQHLKPEYAKAAEDLTNGKTAFVKVDCTDSGKATCDKYQVDSYPTLKLFRNGKYAEDYNGPRTSDGIGDFMKNKMSSKFHLVSDEELADFIAGGGGEARVVGYVDADTVFKKNFFKLAEEMEGKVKFAYKESDGEEGMILYRSPLLKNKFEADRVVYDKGETFEEMKEFIEKNYNGLVGFRKVDNKEYFNTPLVVTYFYINYRRDPKGTNYWRNRVLKVAQLFKNQINFAISNKHDFFDELTDISIEKFEDPKPTVVVLDDQKKKYVMEDVFSVENLTNFVQDFLNGKIEPTVKSEPIPSVNDGPVKIAVAKNFDEVVRNNGKDTILALYAPWCSHCKKLAPIYEELAATLKDEEVEVVKMDATANEVPADLEVKGYPSVYWLAKNKKDEPILYEGERKLEVIIKYVAKYASEELKGYDRDGNLKNVKTEL